MAFSLARLGAAAAVVASILVAATAQGEPTAADRETARSLMQDARDLRDRGDLKHALLRFQAADEIMHVPTTALEVARTQVALGLLIDARDTIAAIRKTPAKPGDPEPFNEARAKADVLDASLEGRVPALTIVVLGMGGDVPDVSIDGVLVPPAVVGLPRRIDPGHHVVVARTAIAASTLEVEVGEGEQKQVELTLAPFPEARTSETRRDYASLPRSHAPNVWTYVGVGAGGAGIVAGTVTGLLSWSKKSSLKSECPNFHCGPGQPSDDLDSASALAQISTISFIFAGIGAGVAAGSLLIGQKPASSPNEPAAAANGLQLTPWVGLASAGMRGSF